MSKTDDINKALEDAIPMLAKNGFVTVLEVDDWIEPAQLVSPGTITMTATSKKYGRLPLDEMPNPRRHWWCFWRPRIIKVKG